MRIVVDRGSNAGAITGYLHRKDKREAGKEQADPVFYTNMFGRNALERTEELRFSADLNQRVEKTYVHYKVSFPPGENPDLEAKKGIVDDLLGARGHGQNCQFFAVEHYEKIDKHDVHHLHVLAASVRLDGSWVDDSFERVRLKQVERDIELKRGLQYCPPREKGDLNGDPIREWKLREKLQADGKTLIKDDLREAINQAAKNNPSMALLVAQLKAAGIEVRVSEFKDGGKGISYKAEGRAFRGRQLGDPYSFNGLHKYAGVSYESERDDAMLRQLNVMTAEQCQALLTQLEQPEPERLSELEQEQPDKEIGQQVQLWDAAQLVQDIWEHSRAGLPQLKTATFEGYQIQMDSAGNLELYANGEKVLARSGDAYQNNGVTQADIERLQTWQQLTLQQHEERMQRRAAQEKEKERQQEDFQKQPTAVQSEKLPKKSQELEL